ncbi:MAG: hypothetical protein JRI36_01425 [Deltaproteobacteria bacterium]|nr:hypothetical protein [Deltaproteobacteria bacterium]
MGLLLIACGVLLVVVGIWGAFSTASPKHTLCALAAVIGLAAAVTGILLVSVPGFFE